MNEQDKERHAKAKNCDVCGGGFTEENPKVADHHHRLNTAPDSNYRNALCNNCNLKHRTQRNVDILSHNLSGFDCHLVINAIANDVTHVKKVENIIAKSMERYVAFDLYFRCDACIAAGNSAKQ